MQPKRIFAALIFLASYLPLSLILLVQDVDAGPACRDWLHFTTSCYFPPLRHPLVAIGAVAVCIVCLFVSLVAIWVTNPKNPVLIEEAKHTPADLMNYALPYVVSFLSLSYSEPPQFFGFLVFFAWIFAITYKSGQVILNPALVVLGWRMYEVRYKFAGGGAQSLTGFALSQVELTPGGSYEQIQIQDVLVVKKQKTKP